MVSPAITFDGRTVPFEDGDTIASALHRAGIRALSRSMKYHRPRGYFCGAGSCGGCLMQVDGVPNTPACMEPARPGAQTVSQNRLGTARRDLLRVVDMAYPEGFDPHAAFTRPGPVNRLFVRAVRRMSGWGEAPVPGFTAGPVGRRRTRHVDELIVGAGQQGLLRARRAARDGSHRVLVVDEGDALGGSARWDPRERETLALAENLTGIGSVETWSRAVAFGIYDGTVAVRRGADLWEVTADRVTLAPGRHDAWPLFPDNDLPGVMSLRGAQRLWYGHGVLPGKRIVGHGHPLPERFVADLEAAGAELVAQGDVESAAGGRLVERVRMQGRSFRTDAVVCHLPGVPRVELFQQAGCALGWDEGPAPVLGRDGETNIAGVYGAFSAGDT